jgi:hypothetical protein
VLESGLEFIESHPPPQKRACEIRQTGYDLLHRDDVCTLAKTITNTKDRSHQQYIKTTLAHPYLVTI